VRKKAAGAGAEAGLASVCHVGFRSPLLLPCGIMDGLMSPTV
jgi:hypothetical protein